MRRNEHGAIMLETVMILPVLLMVVFFLLQLLFVLLAKEMTFYAAYCGARAALVYNPSDYNINEGGIVKKAACTVLAWISQSVEGSTPLKIPAEPEEYVIPRSDNVWDQVTVTILEGLYTDLTQNPPKANDDEDDEDDFPMVTVTVDFKCPLLIPVGGRIFAGFAKKPRYGPAQNPVVDFADAVARGAETEDERGWAYNFIEIRESCSLGKPYNTITFPRIPEEDRFLIRRNEEE